MIKPFADDEAATSIGDLAIENGTSRVAISGSVEITRDQAGLERARALKQLADDLVAELEAGHAPQQVAATQTASVDQVANPFA
ncbi:hypothetical protein E5673_18480 [Sphingomonas sp. PAMC26645]|jgi:hypothetical protein|uniref:hypothetical protein n=1 Tax=Sphingomonas sp. PAMC26645 TaxID=2565555 RepID=UPI00109E3330|nr:hypothetical protein [Sphingomonas sp. PAMC26645]QCB43960.1 hypothetical protein E5673_18480 [Sphingomonas sp. PAMC26645]